MHPLEMHPLDKIEDSLVDVIISQYHARGLVEGADLKELKGAVRKYIQNGEVGTLDRVVKIIMNKLGHCKKERSHDE